MAIKHVVTGGLGFTVPSYNLTDGLGDFSGTPPAGSSDPRFERRRRFIAVLAVILLIVSA